MQHTKALPARPAPYPVAGARVPRLAGPAAAVTAGVGATVHLVVAGAADPLSVPARLVIVAMAVLCSWCVGGLWRSPDLRGWTIAAAMYSAMLVTHLFVLHPLLDSTPATTDPVLAIGMPVMHALPVLTYLIALAAIAILATRPRRRSPIRATTKENVR